VKVRIDEVKSLFVETELPHSHRDKNAWASGGKNGVPTPPDDDGPATSNAHPDTRK
jgi:hypothetical protein